MSSNYQDSRHWQGPPPNPTLYSRPPIPTGIARGYFGAPNGQFYQQIDDPSSPFLANSTQSTYQQDMAYTPATEDVYSAHYYSTDITRGVAPVSLCYENFQTPRSPNHTTTTHPAPTQENPREGHPTIDSRPNEQTRFACNWRGCNGRSYTGLMSLWRHIRTDHVLPGHYCPFCDQSFSRPDHFQSHQRTARHKKNSQGRIWQQPGFWAVPSDFRGL